MEGEPMKHVAIVVAFMASFGTSRGSTIVSTFSNTPPGYGQDSYGLGPTPWAMQFTVPLGSDFQFTGFIVPLMFTGTEQTVDFTLASDLSGQPGAALEKIAV